MVVGNVRLAVRPEQCAVRVDAGNGVVEIVAVALKEADGQHNVQLRARRIPICTAGFSSVGVA